MPKPKVIVTLTHILNNDLWGIEEMLENSTLTIVNVKELIKEDYGMIIENGEWGVCIEMKEE